ncbi:MAG: patatin-like phospholipase family protein [Polyangiaceae bacterium]
MSDERPEGIHLALSGGGLRATLFHAGVIIWLIRNKQLRNIHSISGASGGAITLGYAATHWHKLIATEERGLDDAALRKLLRPLISMATFDLRGRILRRSAIPTKTRTERLAHYLERWFSRATLREIPSEPQFFIVSTSANTGKPLIFTARPHRSATGGDTSSGCVVTGGKQYPADTFRLSQAIAASCAHPAFFPPLRVTEEWSHDGLQKKQDIFDGGIVDNLALSGIPEGFKGLVVVSDAGAGVSNKPITSIPLLRQAIASVRAVDLLMNSALDANISNIGAKLRHLKISCPDDATTKKSVLPNTAGQALARVRTDLDYFAPTLIDALVRRGYDVAESVLGADLGSTDAAGSAEPAISTSLTPEDLLKDLRSHEGIRARVWSSKDSASWTLITLTVATIAIIVHGYHLPNRGPLQHWRPHRLAPIVVGAPKSAVIVRAVYDTEARDPVGRCSVIATDVTTGQLLHVVVGDDGRIALVTNTALQRIRMELRLAGSERSFSGEFETGNTTTVVIPTGHKANDQLRFE